MAIIYRVENAATGYGLYSGDGDVIAKFPSLSTPRHPHPRLDDKLVRYIDRGWFGGWQPVAEPAISWRAGLRFGFSSIEQMRYWLYRKVWRQRLDKGGFVAGEYDAPDAILGDTQAIFNIVTATRLNTIRLTDI